MTAVREYYLYCDYGGCRDMVRCTQYNPTSGRHDAISTLAEARKWARKKGWRTKKVDTIGGDRPTRDYCPRHKP